MDFVTKLDKGKQQEIIHAYHKEQVASEKIRSNKILEKHKL
jgi:hypothetical protein